MLGGLGLALALAASAHAQNGTEAVIAEAQVEVRSGPSFSQDFYATSRLYRGDKVHVLARQDTTGWLAITPPIYSFSWVSARDVEQKGPQTVIVTVPESKLRVGSAVVDAPPEVAKFTQKQGTMLTVIDQPRRSGSETWLPILPAPNEERYIPASAVKVGPLVQQTVAPPLVPAPTSFTSTASSPSGNDAEALRLRAEKADLDNNFPEAIRLYEQLAGQTKENERRIYYLSRANFLRRAQQNASVASTPQAASSTQAFYTNNVQARMTAPPAFAAVQPAPYYPAARPAVSEYCYVVDPCNTVKLSAPLVNNVALPVATNPPVQPSAQVTSAAALATPRAQWYGPAQLRRAPFFMAGRRAYALQDDEGNVLAYVTSDGNLDLEPLVYKTVRLYGPVVYHGEMRKNYMTALQASVMQ
jgi:hypothetical protein